MKFPHPLRNMRQRRADIEALAEKLGKIEEISDSVERLMQFRELKETCDQMTLSLKGNNVVSGLGTGAGGLVLAGAGIATLNPLLLTGGIFAMGAGAGLMTRGKKPKKWSVSPALLKDCDTLDKISKAAETSINDIIRNEPLVEIARAPRFEEAAAAFPALRERFMAATARDKIIEQDCKDNVPKPKDPGFKFN